METVVSSRRGGKKPGSFCFEVGGGGCCTSAPIIFSFGSNLGVRSMATSGRQPFSVDDLLLAAGGSEEELEKAAMAFFNSSPKSAASTSPTRSPSPTAGSSNWRPCTPEEQPEQLVTDCQPPQEWSDPDPPQAGGLRQRQGNKPPMESPRARDARARQHHLASTAQEDLARMREAT